MLFLFCNWRKGIVPSGAIDCSLRYLFWIRFILGILHRRSSPNYAVVLLPPELMADLFLLISHAVCLPHEAVGAVGTGTCYQLHPRRRQTHINANYGATTREEARHMGHSGCKYLHTLETRPKHSNGWSNFWLIITGGAHFIFVFVFLFRFLFVCVVFVRVSVFA